MQDVASRACHHYIVMLSAKYQFLDIQRQRPRLLSFAPTTPGQRLASSPGEYTILISSMFPIDLLCLISPDPSTRQQLRDLNDLQDSPGREKLSTSLIGTVQSMKAHYIPCLP